ncbi:energy transducer TonB [Pontibaca salina]|uniref:Energy transducer TonB n=1 Tax=Pontibaca salina TaxID=2795731 RepID=A0A934HWF8_9RHOB|nr:energy transducer TonB [Pontibaca salina]MBI6630774.1 energy transducer TonB [Pontibaca salina]
MSLTYNARRSGFGFWLVAIMFSAGLHLGFPAQIMSQAPHPEDEEPRTEGITGAIMFDLSDVIAAPSALAEESVAQEESEQTPTVTESPEAVKAAQESEQPILSQIPYDVDDDSLKFGVAAPEPEAQTEEIATEIATEHDPEQIEADSQVGAEDSAASEQSVAGVHAETEADTAEASSEGLTAEQTAEIREWQKSIVLMISRAKTYPSQARRDRIEGEVQVRFTLDRYGAVISAEIADSSGWPVLDRAALETVASIDKMPTPPNYLEGDEFTLLIPLRYRFR